MTLLEEVHCHDLVSMCQWSHVGNPHIWSLIWQHGFWLHVTIKGQFNEIMLSKCNCKNCIIHVYKAYSYYYHTIPQGIIYDLAFDTMKFDLGRLWEDFVSQKQDTQGSCLVECSTHLQGRVSADHQGPSLIHDISPSNFQLLWPDTWSDE